MLQKVTLYWCIEIILVWQMLAFFSHLSNNGKKIIAHLITQSGTAILFPVLYVMIFVTVIKILE